MIYGVDLERDEAELGYLAGAIDRGLPVLAICRGLQVLNVALGGTLHAHLPEVAGLGEHGRPQGGPDTMHEVRLAEGSRVAEACGSDTVDGLSSHHQGIDRVASGLRPVGWTNDGLVEAVELPDGWVVGVQWHPEQTAERDPAQQELFDAFVRRATERQPAAR